MICDIDSIQRYFKSQERESLKRSKHSKISYASSTLIKKNIHSNQKTGIVNEDHPHSASHVGIDLNRLEPDNNNNYSSYEIGKKNNGKYSFNSKSLLQKLILLLKHTMRRVKTGFNTDNDDQDIQNIVSICGIGKNSLKEIKAEEEEQIEIETICGYRIIVTRIKSSGYDRLVIMNNGTHNNLQEKINSIRIDLSQNSVLLSTEKNLSIKASSINIEASESMNLKSGSVMTINGSLVRIN